MKAIGGPLHDDNVLGLSPGQTEVYVDATGQILHTEEAKEAAEKVGRYAVTSRTENQARMGRRPDHKPTGRRPDPPPARPQTETFDVLQWHGWQR